MSTSGADLLTRVHGISSDRIDSIPHGIPHVPVDAASKDRLGVEGKTVILTFGLLSRDKGIEHVIDALPAILAVHPDTVDIVLGATHLPVIEHEGEAYRLMLEARGQQLGVAGSMIFHNRFVSQDELTEFLSATDVYITPSPARTDHIGHAGTPWAPQGGDLDAIHLRARAPRRRTRRSCHGGCSGDRAGSHRPGQRPRATAMSRARGRVWCRDDLAGDWPPLYRELRARAHRTQAPPRLDIPGTNARGENVWPARDHLEARRR